MDNVDCDGHLGGGFFGPKNIEHTQQEGEKYFKLFGDMKCEMVIKRKHLFILEY
jgi:hypothetical protein